MTPEEPKEVQQAPQQVECPKCHHKFWHKLGDALKQAGESIGDAIGEAKYGG